MAFIENICRQDLLDDNLMYVLKIPRPDNPNIRLFNLVVLFW